jgi:hypothetical protein
MQGAERTQKDKRGQASEGFFRVLHSQPSFEGAGQGAERRDSLEMRKRKKIKDLMLG